MDRGSIGDAIRRVVEVGHGDLVAVYVFGSTARGTRRDDSDVDVGVLLQGQPPRTLAGLKLGLEGELERALGLPVQLVVLNTAPPDLIHRVLRDGDLLLDRDPSARIRFEVQARREYFDVLPYLRRYRRLEPAAP
jgi:predicted nucleotidyltransferase